MHELSISQAIVTMAVERAGTAKVLRVVLEVGQLAAIVPESLQFCFGLACAGTPLEGATLEIVPIAGRGRCRACNQQVVLSSPTDACTCGSNDLEWTSGQELNLREMEVV